MNKTKVKELFEIFKKNNEKPETELIYHNNYQLLVAVVLSAQSTDKGVNKATKELFRLVRHPQEMVEIGEESLLNHIKTIGLFRNKGKNVMSLSKILVENHNGEVPNTREELESLPGVGRKTANVVLNVAFGQKTMAVDTHIFRVSNRLGLVNAKNVKECEDQLLKVIPDNYLIDSHHWLILHGRYVCKARSPICGECNVYDLCEYKEKIIKI